VDLLQLRYFQAVARHQHVSRAAAELRVAQPALSRAIARLEAELGVPLFDRRGRRVRLNRFGVMFLARAGRALDELDQGQREVRAAEGRPAAGGRDRPVPGLAAVARTRARVRRAAQ
jgi:DNA-binding transcriptional LysR family regulator